MFCLQSLFLYRNYELLSLVIDMTCVQLGLVTTVNVALYFHLSLTLIYITDSCMVT